MPSRIENLIRRVDTVAPSLATTLYQSQQEFSRADTPKKIKYDTATETLVFELLNLYQATPGLVQEALSKIETATASTLDFILELIVSPPKGIDVCSRNPLQELPQLSRLLLQHQLVNEPVPVVVPVCPDLDQYKLGDDLGGVIPRALSYIEVCSNLFERKSIKATFDIQVADVEGLDPIMLQNTGETTDSHFQKTAETLRKTRELVRLLWQRYYYC
jgi:hypothetical protein